MIYKNINTAESPKKFIIPFKTAGAIGEAETVTQEVKDISTINPELDGKVIHALGFADTNDILKDEIFGVQERAIKLSRKVEYFQWEEHSHTETRKKLGGGEETITTYTYEKEWTSYSFKRLYIQQA